MLLPPALGFSPHPPVSVYGTGICHTIAAFLDSWNPALRYFCSLRITSLDYEAGFSNLTPPTLAPVFSFLACSILLCPHSSDDRWYRNINLLSIGYAFQPRLRPRLPQSRISFTLETLDIRPGGFSPPSRYSFRHSLFSTLHSSFRYCFVALTMLLYHSLRSPKLRCCVLAPDIFGAGPLD